MATGDFHLLSPLFDVPETNFSVTTAPRRIWSAISRRSGADRQEALRQMTQRYIEHMHTNEPVHTWPVTA